MSNLAVTIIVSVIIALLGGTLGATTVIFLDRWTGEMGEHNKTRNSEASAIDERNRLRSEVAVLREENAGLKKLQPILQFYGPRAKYTASYDLNKEANSMLEVGRCPNDPCIVLTLLERAKADDGVELARLGVSGRWAGFQSQVPTFKFSQPITSGCRSLFRAGPYQVTFMVEKDGVNDMRVGMGISVRDFQEGLHLVDQECL